MILLSDVLAESSTGRLPIVDIGADYTVTEANAGVCLRYTGVAAATFTFDRTMPRGTVGSVLQYDVGAVMPSADGDAPDLVILFGATKTAGKGAEFVWKVVDNADGNSAEIVISGAMTP